MIFVADAADIVCGAKNPCGAILLHMTSNFAPYDKIVCNVEQFVIDKFLHICNKELLVFVPPDTFTM